MKRKSDDELTRNTKHAAQPPSGEERRGDTVRCPISIDSDHYESDGLIAEMADFEDEAQQRVRIFRQALRKGEKEQLKEGRCCLCGEAGMPFTSPRCRYCLHQVCKTCDYPEEQCDVEQGVLDQRKVLQSTIDESLNNLIACLKKLLEYQPPQELVYLSLLNTLLQGQNNLMTAMENSRE